MPTFLSADVLKDLAKSRGRAKREQQLRIAVEEWKFCSEHPLNWLDCSLHYEGMAYAYTLDNHPMYQCKLCPEQNGHWFNKLGLHLDLRHGIVAADEKELRGYFIALPTVRPFTVHDYMRPIIEQWLKEQYVMVPKSRDMMATWLCVALYTWDTIFHEGHQNIFQSQNAPKTSELVRRAMFMWRQQPAFLKKLYGATYADGSNRSGEFKLPTLNSEILGFPQGPSQIRQYHPTGLFFDEAAYQEQAGDAFAAIKPAIQQGGRFTAVSSAAPSWFMLACQDRLEES